MVRSGTPIIGGPEYDMYAGAAIPAVKTDKLAYFALSVFWRSVAMTAVDRMSLCGEWLEA